MKLIALAILLAQSIANAGDVFEYPVYTNPKTVNGEIKAVELSNTEVKKVPATYRLEVPLNCDRSENNCRLEEVVISYENVLQITVSYYDGRNDENGREEYSALDINLPITKFSTSELSLLNSKDRKVRKQAQKDLLNLIVAVEKVPSERTACRMVGEDWVCDGEKYIDYVTVTNIGVERK